MEENKQITPLEIYIELKNLEKALQKKGVISQVELSENKDTIWNWPEQTEVLADEDLLAEDWLSPEDEEAWKDL
ncbi:MAG: hypothetical protein AABW65_01580 [Nanoarchaeota archaeon]